MPPQAHPWDAAVVAVEGGVRVRVRAQPRASRDAIVDAMDDGRGGVALKVAVTAPPVEGEANAAIVSLFARVFDVPKRDVSISSGETGRNKSVGSAALALE
jgi:uncharacterized protein (TIGR00251 family)